VYLDICDWHDLVHIPSDSLVSQSQMDHLYPLSAGEGIVCLMRGQSASDHYDYIRTILQDVLDGVQVTVVKGLKTSYV
jgi:hypothetical protein